MAGKCRGLALRAAESGIVVLHEVRRALWIGTMLTVTHADPSLALALQADFGSPTAPVLKERNRTLKFTLGHRVCYGIG